MNNLRMSNLRLMALLTSVVLIIVSQSVLAQSEDAASAIPVTVSEVANERLAGTVPAAGTVFSRNAAQITAGLQGRLEWVAEPGDYIEAGQPVARFDCEHIELLREEQVVQSELEQVRHDSLVREITRMEAALSATSQLQYERVIANRDLSQSQIGVIAVRIRQFESQLRRCTELAPFSGVVTAQMRRGGEDVPRGDLLATMTDIRNLEVRAAVPIRHLPRMNRGSIAEVRLNDIRYSGQIRTVVPAANAASQTFEVRIDLPEQAFSQMAAGQLVSVTLPLQANSALTVPRDSIVLRQEGAFVMRVDQSNIAQSIAVEVNDANGDTVSVIGDLQSGDLVVVRGAEALADGNEVEILPGS
ncbi:MAG TPA: efflux RND transporter periplasmic adaptor subunit [Xanthomonadales bacterium]|nr:efflux RND transporter periplasmic adaptor subunit [Xanthomonadales bacterium]